MSSGSFSAALRFELSQRNREYATRRGLSVSESYGDPPVICYQPDGLNHGNFLPETYRAILRNPQWTRRLAKVHAQARSTLPRADRRWCELDSGNSSDALLMNVFCYPQTLRRAEVAQLLGIEPGLTPDFGVKAKVPFSNGRFDRTEVDMRLGDLLVEAKLTESDFQTADPILVESYRDLHDVFNIRQLPQCNGRYLSYQLIRNVLAAHSSRCSICVMADARRPDLRESWYEVMSCVLPVELRWRCKMLTWQEVAAAAPQKLQRFLEEKYGIHAA